MLRCYDNPNTCYAIGDAFAVQLGTAASNRQPSAGVFEEVSFLMKANANDAVELFNGTAAPSIMETTAQTSKPGVSSTQFRDTFNMALKIGNSVYIRKSGTTDYWNISGVQVDA